MNQQGWDTWGQAASGVFGGIADLFRSRDATAAQIEAARLRAQGDVAHAEIANANARALFGISGAQSQQYLIVGVVVLIGIAFIFRAKDIRG